MNSVDERRWQLIRASEHTPMKKILSIKAQHMVVGMNAIEIIFPIRVFETFSTFQLQHFGNIVEIRITL